MIETFERRIRQLIPYNCSVIRSELMARGTGSICDCSLAIGKRYHVGVNNLGLSITRRKRCDGAAEEPVGRARYGFDAVFRKGGVPYRRAETNLIPGSSAGSKGRRCRLMVRRYFATGGV